ncbi:MAG: MmcQ/YjbR family DNA-binding protein [Bacteroidales bacterium]|nr:MmcQ/YjbR family DNA-binding protein [Bacteroidales bacterium]MCF8352442.1 MmcQ/YjbR family DNA-binding protein [Bacteroidales bacterium]MCF8377422.1 MmcQ/YjbR family DNA-binding protein [Bacteroidales bacterium]MCF8401634.1 MmcQ/YjbR family DNA-binding protein [Bacteroidales bacterium]
MHIEQIRSYCLSKKQVTEGFPFDNETLVFKVAGKIFALLGLDEARINLKCDPQQAIELRERYPFVIPGYHMNKKHWNTIVLDEAVKDDLLKVWIDRSYGLVVSSLPKKVQAGFSSD